MPVDLLFIPETKLMPRALSATATIVLTPEERRERRALRREKQRENNILRAAKMHKARLKMEADGPKAPPGLKETVYVGCSGWRYWKWRDSFYAAVPQPERLPAPVMASNFLADRSRTFCR